jgi:hypothetical protein
MSHHAEVEMLRGDEPRLNAPAGGVVALLAVIGVAGLAVAVFLAGRLEHGAETFFRSYLVSLMFFLSLALGGLFFVLITHLLRAGWSVALRRLAETLAWGVLPLTPLAAVLLLGLHELYEWTHADVVAADALLQHKRPYLNENFFMLRLGAYFLVWNFLGLFYLRRSLTQDRTRDPGITVQLEKLAGPAIIFYAMSVTFAAVDLIMTLYPHWYSTMYGVYYFAGSVLAFFSLVPLIMAGLQRAGKLRGIVSTEHYHDMGKLMFAFVVFWAYIAFSQYFLIWYGNIPEETGWYKLRQSGPWAGVGLLLLFGHFIVPFLWLMSRHPKRRRITLLVAAVWLLAMHWFDLFYLVIPESRPQGPLFSPMDLACFVGLGGLFFAAVRWRLGRSPLVPVGDPRIDESLRFENG